MEEKPTYKTGKFKIDPVVHTSKSSTREICISNPFSPPAYTLAPIPKPDAAPLLLLA